MPPLIRRPPDRRTRVLALAEDLAEELADDLEAVDLDAVDGEFFWRCCRGDLLDAVEALCAKGPQPVGFDPDHPGRREEPGGLFDYLRQGLRFADDFLALADEAARLYPGVVWHRLLDGERVAMRAAEAEWRRPDGGGPADPSSLLLRVFSGAWTGRQVEDEVRRLAAGRPERFGMADLTGAEGGAVAVRVRFAFGDGRRAYADAADVDPPRAPYVEVSVPLPLPPQGAIAREYEALVRGELGWHLLLPGGGSRQDKEVAVRTWAVGLLVGVGVPFGDAMHAVASRTGFAPVSQARFGQDRQRLLERVPEAEPHIFAKGQSGAGARGERPAALANPTSAEALANPDGPLAPLQAPADERGAYT